MALFAKRCIDVSSVSSYFVFTTRRPGRWGGSVTLLLRRHTTMGNDKQHW